MKILESFKPFKIQTRVSLKDIKWALIFAYVTFQEKFNPLYKMVLTCGDNSIVSKRPEFKIKYLITNHKILSD